MNKRLLSFSAFFLLFGLFAVVLPGKAQSTAEQRQLQTFIVPPSAQVNASQVNASAQMASGVVLIGLKGGTTMNAPRMQSNRALLDTTLTQIGVRHIESVFPTIRDPRAPTSINGLVELSNVYRLRLAPDANMQDVINSLRANPAVQYAEPDYLAHIIATPNDPQLGSQWGLAKIDAAKRVGRDDRLV